MHIKFDVIIPNYFLIRGHLIVLYKMKIEFVMKLTTFAWQLSLLVAHRKSSYWLLLAIAPKFREVTGIYIWYIVIL